MCRGFQQNERDRLLKIKAFYLRLSVSNARKPLPDSLTLHYLPRINGSPLEINDSKIRSDSPAFVTLHRVVSPANASVFFGSREAVRASEGVRFEVYFGDAKVLKGIFRKDQDDEWKMECKSGLETELVGADLKAAEVCVAAEGDVAMTETVEMVVKKRRSSSRCFQGLEEIPEGREVELEGESDGCCCCGQEMGSDGGDCDEEIQAEMEGVRWAVDVGIWVMCLGVGYLVSKASSKTMRRRRIL